MSLMTRWGTRPEITEDEPAPQTLSGLATPTAPAEPKSRDPHEAVSARRRAPSRSVDLYRGIAVGQAGSDAACAVLAFLLAGLWASDGLSLPAGFLALALLAPLPWLAVFWTVGLYRNQHPTRWDEFQRILRATMISTAAILLGSVWVDLRSLRATFLATTLIALVLEVVTREAWRLRMARLDRSGGLAFRTLIVGTNGEAGHLARALQSDERRFLPLGYVAASGPRGTANGLKVLGTIDELGSAIRRHRADYLFVASTDVSAADMVELSRVARREDVEVRVSANLPDILTTRVSVESIADLTTLSIKPVRLTPGKAAVKRVVDIAVASGALLAALPVMAAVALAVRVTSRGPVLFTQDRVTKGGLTFRIYKFRTMAHQPYTTPTVSEIDPTTPYFKLDNDPRLTRIGGVLRRYSLDELPQFWNVIRGDISLVGPRPLWSAQVDPLSELFRCRHEVRTGLTGWWQVNGRSGVGVDEALKMDLFYVENWSLGLDLRILLSTIPTVLRKRGAY